MLAKSIISFIFAHILFFGGTNTQVYTAPIEKTPLSATSTEIKKSTPLATTTPIKKPTIKAPSPTTKKVSRSEQKPIYSATTTVTAKEPEPDFVAINSFARTATINILCTTKGGDLSPISGTGAIVEPDGLILTNAHIGQYLLLKDFGQKDYVNCVARTGSPAYPKYNLELVYISPTWVENNKALLKEQNPKGTGENDFAFLRITSMIDGSNLPESFPFVTMNIRENILRNESVLLSSYPAGFLGGIYILQDLNVMTAVTTVQDLYTFKDGTIDLVDVGGTVVSQKGSSGGLVVDKNGTLIGVISTSSDGDTTSKRALNAITLAYINRALQTELKLNLQQFLTQSSKSFTELFQKTTAPLLTKIITDELTKQ